MDKFELEILNRFRLFGSVELPIGDQSLINRYKEIVKMLSDNGYIAIKIRNNNVVSATITNDGICFLKNNESRLKSKPK